MSLINEALKRARSEAQRQAEAEREGVAPAPAWTPPPFSRRERSPILASVAASVGATALILGLGYLLLRGRSTAPPVAAPLAAPAPAVSTSSAPVPAVEPPAAPPRPAPQMPTAATVTPASPSATPSVAHPRPSVASSGTGAPTAPVRAGSAGGKTFVREARLSDGTTIELGGIISGAIPLAMLNWKMIGIGEYAGGCSLTKIEPHRVELHGPDGTFWIELQ